MTSTTIDVDVVADEEPEVDEFFLVQLVSVVPSNQRILDGQVTILSHSAHLVHCWALFLSTVPLLVFLYPRFFPLPPLPLVPSSYILNQVQHSCVHMA